MKKKQRLSIITTLADIQLAIFGDQFLQSIMYLFYFPSEMQSWWSQGALWDFEVQKSRESETEDSQPRFLPAELLWPQVNRAKLSKLKISLVGHTAVWCTYWKINLVKQPVRIDLQCQWISKTYLMLFKWVLLPKAKLDVKSIYRRYVPILLQSNSFSWCMLVWNLSLQTLRDKGNSICKITTL